MTISKLVFKTLKYYSISFCLMAVLFWYVDHTDEMYLFNRGISNEKIALKFIVKELVWEVNQIKNDARLVMLLPSVKSFLKSRDRTNKEVVEETVKVISENSGYYDQIRIIGVNGDELVRVDYKDGRAFAVPDHRLQNKKHRDYFKFLINSDGDIHILGLDLNIEHKKIEIPYKPMIRVGARINDQDGKPIAVILLNYYAQNLIDLVEKEGESLHGQLYLVYNSGHWIIGPRKEHLWGNVVKENSQYTFQSLFPNAWSKIIRTNDLQVHSGEHIFLSRPVYWNGSGIKLISYIDNIGVVAGPHKHIHIFFLFSVILFGICFVVARLKLKKLEYKNQSKLVKSRLMQTKRLASVSHLGAGIAHELNTPLTSILGYLTYLHDEINVNKKTPDDIGFCIKESNNSMSTVIDIIKRVMQFSTYQEKNAVKPVSINELITTYIYEKDFKLKSHGVDITYVNSGNSKTIPMVKDDLYIIINEVVTNAMESYDGVQGKKIIHIVNHHKDDGATITVSDSGVGIMDSDLEKVFDPFFSTKVIGKNKGLGLSVAYGLIEKYFGSIVVESTLNKGTTITIHFPNQRGSCE